MAAEAEKSETARGAGDTTFENLENELKLVRKPD